MNWTTIILISVFVLQVFGKQTNQNGVKSKRNSSHRTVRLDPLLRKALLRALTELEKEAQEKIRQEEEEKSRSEKKDLGKRGNNVEEFDNSGEEIQKTADTRYPTHSPIVNNPETEPPQDLTTTTTVPDVTDPSFPVTIKDAFFFHTPTPIEHEFTSPAVQDTRKPDPTLSPPDVESNLISEPRFKENLIEATNKPEEFTTTKSEIEEVTTSPDSDAEKTKSSDKDTEVELFQAPLVAAFTLHQDSRGTPQSVIPLIKPDPVQSQNFFQQQNFQFRQQPQQQFIPSVTITPLSQPNNFNQAQRAFASTSIPSSTAFPPLASNSIVPSSFQASIVPSQSFAFSSTVPPLSNNNGFGSTSAALVSSPSSFATTPAPFVSSTTAPRNVSPESIIKPQSELASDISIVQSHVFNLPSPSTELVAPKPQSPQPFEQFNIPPVTLPLQNEPRAPFSFNNQGFGDRPKRIEDQTQQFRFGDQNRLRQANKAAELRQEGFEQVKPEQLDFLRSIGFTFQNDPKPAQLRAPTANNPFSFSIQQSQTTSFEDIQTRNRVNRQEGFGSTGNFGFNRPVNQIPQFQKDQRGFRNPVQQFGNLQQFQQYRTIPDEHYQALLPNRFQQFQPFQQFNPSFQQFKQQNQFQAPPVTKQLENLLIQSGVAAGDASRQEDLNIVSKVLALNHERSDTQVSESNRRFARDERTVSIVKGKELLIGEISDTPFLSKLSSQ